MSDDLLESLTREKNLWGVWRDVVRKIPTRRLYAVVVWVAAVLSMAGAACSRVTAEELGDLARTWSGAAFGFAASVLGIILAGFAIFSTIATSPVAEPLATIPHDDSGLAYGKYIAGCFVKAMLPYVAFIGFHVLLTLFGWKNGPITLLMKALATATGFAAPRWGAVVALGVLGGFFVQLVVSLQALIFNVYAAFMMMIRAKVEMDAMSPNPEASPAADTAPSSTSATNIGPRVAPTSLPIEPEHFDDDVVPPPQRRTT